MALSGIYRLNLPHCNKQTVAYCADGYAVMKIGQKMPRRRNSSKIMMHCGKRKIFL